MSIDVNVQNDLVIVTETTEDIVVNVSNAAGPQGPAGAAGVGVPVGGTTGQVLKKFTNSNYDTYWAADASGLTSVGLSVPTGLSVTNSPLTTNGTIALGLASGYSIPTTASQATWNTAYNDSIVSAAVTGTTTKTLTLNQQDGGSVTASWSDLNTDAVTSVFGRTGAVVATEGDYTLTQLGDVTLTSPTNGQVLKYNGTTWVNNTDTDTGLTSVGLSMPSAFAVSNSPLTSNGTIAVTGAGTSAQYVRGDGQLANFPTNGGGGSSVNYYLNGSVSQGTFGGDTYYEMSKTPIIGAGTNFTRTNAQGNGYIASFITDAGDPALLNIPGGNWNVEFYFQASSGGSNPSFYAELYKVSSSNVFTLIGSGSTNPEGITNGTAIDQYFTSIPVPQTALLATNRIAIRIFVTPSGRTITLHTENSNLCEVLTTFSTGLNALNGLTEQVQYFATGTSGNDFAISSTTDTHTFNLPIASGTNTGKLSNTDWTTFNNKQNTITNPVTGTGTTNYLPKWTSGSAIGNSIVQDNGSAVGIGVSSFIGGYKLEVSGLQRNFGANNELRFGELDANYNFFQGVNQAGTVSKGFIFFGTGEYMRITPNSNLLVGGTNDNGNRLQVAGTMSVTGASTFGGIMTVNTGASATTTNFINNGDFVSNWIGNSTVQLFSIRNDTNLGVFLNTQNSASLRLGVSTGTTGGTVVNHLEIASTGAATFSSSVTATSLIKSGGTSSQYLMADGSTSTLTNPVTGTGTTNYLPKWTSGSAIGNSLVYDNGTNVLINSVIDSGQKLQVNGTIKADGRIFINAGNGNQLYLNNAGERYTQITFDNNSTSISQAYLAWDSVANFFEMYAKIGGGLKFYANQSEAMCITTSSFVGIGTSTPSYKLDVNRSSLGAIAQFITLDGTYNPRLLINGTSEGIQLFATYSSGGAEALMFGTANTERMRLTSNLIIGSTVDSGERLQVSGSVKATSFIKSGGTSSQYLMADGSVTTGGGLISTNRQTASYTLALTDADKLVEMNVATANNLTVPLNSSVAFAIGTKIDLAQYGAGQTTVVATSGVTVRSAGGALKLAVQYSGGSLVKIGTDEWYLFGDITV